MATQAHTPADAAETAFKTANPLSESGKVAVLRKKLIRRLHPEPSQTIRRSFQVAFLLLNVWIGAGFYFWVRGFEIGAHDRGLPRPAGVEGWLPIAGLMNFRYWVSTGHFPATHPAALFLFVSFLAIAFLFRKAFCSWLCPVGTLSEYLWRAGRQILRRNFRLPKWVDLPLRSLKYLLLGFFVWAIANMSGGRSRNSCTASTERSLMCAC